MRNRICLALVLLIAGSLALPSAQSDGLSPATFERLAQAATAVGRRPSQPQREGSSARKPSAPPPRQPAASPAFDAATGTRLPETAEEPPASRRPLEVGFDPALPTSPSLPSSTDLRSSAGKAGMPADLASAGQSNPIVLPPGAPITNAPALPVDGSPSPKLVQLVSDQAALAVPTTFGQPDYDSVSLTGHYAFTDGGATALFYRANGSGAAVRVFQRGDAIPGIDGTYLNSFYQPLVNAAGQVAVQVGAYHGGTSKTALIAWTVSSSRVVAFSSDPAPEPGGAAYGTLSIRGQNEPGDVVFTASLTLPGTTASRSAIFLAPAGGGTPVRLAGFGDPAPGTGGTLGLPSSSYVRVNDARDVLFSAPITGGTGGSGIFIRTDSGLAKVAATGDSDLQGSSFGSSASFTSIFLNNLGLAAFRESNRIYVYTPGAGLSLVADLSTPVPAGLGGSFSSLSGPHGFNDAGDLLFTATITGSAATTNGIFLKRSGSALEAIAWKNQAVPGLGGPTFNLFSTPAMNGAAQVAFRASITGAAPVLDGVFKKSPGEGVAAVVIDGAASGLPGGGTLWPGTSVLILADGRLFLEADVAGGTADYAALVASTGGLAALVTTADPLPAGSRVVIRNPWLGARGDWVGFVPRRAGGGSAIYVHRVSTGTNYRVAADGDTAPLPGGGRMRVGGGGSLVNVDGNGNVVFSGVVNGSTSALFRWTPTGGVQKIAAQSDSTPGGAFTSFTLASLGPSPISNAGHVAFRASIPISAIYVAPPSGQPSKIADANTMVPPGTTYFSTLTGSPIVNSNGRVAFKATTRVMGSAGSTEGIHVGEAGTGTSRVAAIGDVTAWGIISAMSVPLSMNDAGEVLFSATLDGGSAGGGLFTGTGSGPIQAVALDAAPSPDGGTFSISSSLLQARIDNEGRVVFCSLLTGGAAPSGMFLRKSASGPTVAVALEGTPAPGTDGTLGVMSPESINSVPGGEYLTLGPAGEVFAYVSVLRTGGTGKAGLFRYRTDSVLEKVAIVGDPIPGGSGVGTVFAVAQMPAAGDPGRFFTYLPTDQGDGIWMTTGTISMGDLNHLYDGTPHPVSVAATPSSLVASVVYTGRGGTVYGPSAAPPSAAGTYDVTASANDAGTPIFETATLTIELAPVAVNVTGLLQTYDGTRRAATVTTTPAGLAVTTTYTGADATSYGPTQVPPTAAGTYAVLAVVVDPNHVGLATGAMKIVSPPAITSASATAFTKEQYAQFTVTATGYPTPAISSTGSLPVGLTFTDNGNGTATIAGTPSWIVSEGTYPVAIIASNGVSPDASQPFTLTVSNASVTISGYVLTAGGGGVSDVSMSGLPGTPRTNAAGYYAATLPSGWSGTVMPLRAGWSFSPPSSAFTNLTSAANADFEETAAGNAVFDAVRHVPACAAGEASCDSGTLLAGRGTMAGGSEPNQPNTLFDSCPDGSQGTYESDQSIERIRVSSLDGSPLSAGGQAAIDVTLWASTYEDVLDLFYTSDASAPEWILAATIPARPGRNQVLSTVVALPGGASQAVRAKLRYRGDRAPCGTGGLVDHDDLAFSVSGTDVSIANATAIWGSTVQVPITALADGNEHAIAFTAEFEAALVSYDGVSLGSGSLANGAVLNLDPRPAEGRIGIVVLMPPGQVFPAGRWEIAVLQLIAQSGSGVAESGIRFGDLIYARQVEAASGAALPAAWHDAQLTLGEVRVSSVSPDRGVTTGDQEVTITGSGFVPGVTSVSIGGSPSKSVNVTSPGSLTAITPPGVQGPADVVVSVPSGSGMLEGGFLYEAPRAANVAPDLSIRLSHTGVFLLGSPGVYTISVSNNGAAATTGEVVVVNTLPSGLSFVSASGAGWTCMGEGTNVGCRYSLPLQPASLSRAEVEITVAVSSGAASQVTNTARTWTAGDAGSAEDNIASDLIFIAGTGFGETPFLAADYEHTCALTAAGGVVCWGDNANGRLGDGTTLARSMPVPVVGLSRGVGAVSAGIYHACALTTAGGVKCWGDNAWGELGDGTTTPSSTPVDVVGLTSGVVAISAGSYHTCAVTGAGGVKCWGYGEYGELGDGNTVLFSSTPVDVVGVSGTLSVSGGTHHTCALTAAGGVKCWGSNGSNQLGDGTTEQRLTAVDVVGLASGVSALASGGYHNCALMVGGGLKCWGANWVGQLGDGTTTPRSTVVDVTGLSSGVLGVSAGTDVTCAVTASGGAKCWGSNGWGTLGDGTTNSRSAPVDVAGLTSGVAAIAAGNYHTCALKSAGGAECWGNDYAGQLGAGRELWRAIAAGVGGLSAGAVRLGAGAAHSCAVTSDAGLKCWGSNEYAQSGPNAPVAWASPVDVPGVSGSTRAVGAGAHHTCVLTPADGVKCFGTNGLGQLGNGSTTSSFNPVDVIGLATGVLAVAVGDNHACALTSAGGVKCWGDNAYGQLGDGTTTLARTPVDVNGLANGVTAIAAGASHTCAVTVEDDVLCWGRNLDGELGDGTTTSRAVPGFAGVGNVVWLALGGYHSCAMRFDGEVYCWGLNSSGEIGDGTTTSRMLPAPVSGIVAATITAGSNHTCAITTSGAVKCWGGNALGQLGDGWTANESTPRDAVGLESGVFDIRAGATHTCAVVSGGAVKCWGGNSRGQIGGGAPLWSYLPVPVIGF